MNKLKLYWDIMSPTLGIMIMGIGVFLGVGLFLSIPLCLLWNWLMPTIFGLPTLNILETFGLTVLISLLAPRPFSLENKEVKENDDSGVNEKLEEVLKDITSQFNA